MRKFSEHFHQSCSDELKSADSGLFGFWLRFSSVTGFFKRASSPKPRQKPRILAAHRCTFSVNALVFSAALAAGFLLASPLHSTAAETDSPALSGPTTTNRTIITSDQGDFYMKSNVYVYRGDVRVDNPQMKLTCGLLVTESPKLKEGKFDRATAETNVVIDWVDENGTNHATAEKAIYTYSITNIAMAPPSYFETNAIVVLTGHPVVENARGVFRSDPIIWDRIKDIITTTNFNRTDIYQSPSNAAPGFFQTAPETPAKKIVPAK